MTVAFRAAQKHATATHNDATPVVRGYVPSAIASRNKAKDIRGSRICREKIRILFEHFHIFSGTRQYSKNNDGKWGGDNARSLVGDDDLWLIRFD